MAGRAAGGQFVLQYNLEYRGIRQGCLCRKTGSRVVIQQVGRWVGRAGRAGGSRRALGSGRAGSGRAGGRCGRAQGVARHGRLERWRACGSAKQAAAGARGARQAGLRRGARGRQALSARGARGPRPGFGLYTRCTRPVFGLVRLGIFLSQIFGHCL